ncbi:DUF6161 domain-containing protein [Thioclava sp. DLFJ4-1]|uniref:DUF6161 domain-containing protein n=1 Tax=Thioclava sp. DLFJ4-1 TaxID=1915313 RepID=UPI000998D22C|nr:DUF6161 domain-containing protein [Thioclava sp. DLFJ4-1]OOY16706.1 hypothetical protein BMI85_06475 [Thioclava sp. DLFJ4-1]
MARKLSISVPGIGSFRASSKKALIALLVQEKEFWESLFPEGVPTRFNDHHRTRTDALQYSKVISTVEESSVDELRSDVSLMGVKVFPPRGTAMGKVLAILSSSDNPRYKFVIANVMTARLRVSEGVPRNQITGDFEQNMLTVSQSIEALADVVENFKSSLFLREQEKLVKSLVENISLDQVAATEASLKLSTFSSEEIARRRAETSRFRRIRLAIADRYKARGEELVADWDGRFRDAHDRYIKKLQFEAPVTLWKREKKRHTWRSNVALFSFILVLILIIGAATCGVIAYGDTIANSFHRNSCSTADPFDCRDILNAKGPLTVGVILLAASMLLWLMKILNRTYREAGQHAENAAERKAFVETYQAMIESGQVPEEHRAIILNAVFRPSKDGQPVDDNSGLDVSAVSAISKILHGGRV